MYTEFKVVGSKCLDNKYNVHVLTAFVLSENMQPKEGSQPNYSRDSPTKMQSLSENEPPSHTNPSTLDSGFAGCLSYTSNSDYTSSLDTPYVHQQPATLNLPAVLWDKPAGSKIRVPPPVPPRSPRRPIDPVNSGAFDVAMGGPAIEGSNHIYNAPQRGLTMDLTAFIKNRFS